MGLIEASSLKNYKKIDYDNITIEKSGSNFVVDFGRLVVDGKKYKRRMFYFRDDKIYMVGNWLPTKVYNILIKAVNIWRERLELEDEFWTGKEYKDLIRHALEHYECGASDVVYGPDGKIIRDRYKE